MLLYSVGLVFSLNTLKHVISCGNSLGNLNSSV